MQRLIQRSQETATPLQLRLHSDAGRWTSLACVALLSLSVLSACSFGDSSDNGNAGLPPPSSTADPSAPAAPTVMDTFRALAPPEGLKFTPMFAEQLSDTDARFARLENSVQSLRDDFDTVVPSLVRLVAVEKDMKDLISQLKTLTDGTEMDAVPVPEVMSEIPGGSDAAGGTEQIPVTTTTPVAPEAASDGQLPPDGAASTYLPGAPLTEPNTEQSTLTEPPTQLTAAPSSEIAPPPVPLAAAPAEKEWPMPVVKAPEVKAPVVTTPATPEQSAAAIPTHGTVKAVRIADHADKTRIVIDMTGDVKYTATLDPKVLTIELPGLDFAAAKSWDAMTADLVAGYRYDNGKLLIDVLYPSEIKSQSILAPNGETKNYRLVIDLYSKHVHGN